jgi:hypothetical protein
LLQKSTLVVALAVCLCLVSACGAGGTQHETDEQQIQALWARASKAAAAGDVAEWQALELLTRSIAESSPADERSSEVEESLVDVGAAFPTDGQAPVLVQ